ncbi:MAG: hypothetical protein ACLU4N_22655 [Butyricimonas faecihominis]
MDTRKNVLIKVGAKINKLIIPGCYKYQGCGFFLLPVPSMVYYAKKIAAMLARAKGRDYDLMFLLSQANGLQLSITTLWNT